MKNRLLTSPEPSRCHSSTQLSFPTDATPRKFLAQKCLTFDTVRYIVCITHYATHGDPLNPDAFENLRLELRRGSVVLAVLAALREERYGYTLRKTLSDHGLEIDESTLYPLLRRLEAQGLLDSQWREEDKRKKRFYILSTEGARVLEQLLDEWRGIDVAIEKILKERNNGND